MENETVNLETGTVTEAQEERTFTQPELNAIITDRLAREREKYRDYETLKQKAAQFDAAQEAGKTALQKAEEKAQALQEKVDAYAKAEAARAVRAKIAQETGVPSDLLFGESEEVCQAQAQAILAYANSGSYPAVQDGGEITHKPTSGATRDQFAAWFQNATT